MDAYYQAQAQVPYFKGGNRQRGSGLGSLALAVGRSAIPVFKNVLLPAAKRFGRDLVESAIPEVADVLQGKKSLKQAARGSLKKSVRKQIGGGSSKRNISKKRKRSRSKSRPKSRVKRRKKVTRKRRRANSNKPRKSVKRSRFDIFDNLT